jgi:dihydrodipicolinate synthase/N-acetylneuraminate lyase
MKKRQEKLVGPVVSLPTFVDDNHKLLLDRQAKHIRWLIDHGIGVNGNGVLLAAGGYGEGYFMDDGELFAIVDVLVAEAKGEVPTMIGIFDLNARTAARRAKYAGDAGIDFIELGFPHYSSPSEEDVFLYTKYVNDNADVGLMNYNNFWVTPAPGYEIQRTLFERFIDLENVVGFKWSSASAAHYVGMLKLFADEFAFIDNGMMNSQGARHGMAGFVDFFGNVAPSLSLKKWEMFRDGKYDELDELLEKLHFDTDNRLSNEVPAFASVADGVFGHARWETLGLHAGPNFPAQASAPQALYDHTRKVFTESGLMDLVEWDQSIFD